MIIALGRVRDGQILPTEYLSAHEHVIVPIFSPGDAERHVACWKTREGNRALCVCAPPTVKPEQVMAWFKEVGERGLPAYLNTVPARYNPFLQGARTQGGILIPGELGMRVTEPPK